MTMLYEGMPLDQVQLNWRTRVQAWWEGYDLSRLHLPRDDEQRARLNEPKRDMSRQADSAPPAAVERPEPGLDRHGRVLWSLTRIQLAELMWGEGFIEPGGGSWIPKLLATLPLNPTSSLLDLSAGLGGVMKQAAERFGSYVDGVDRHPLLVEVCQQRLGGFADPSKVRATLLTDEDIPSSRRYEFCIALNIFYTFADKERLWRQLAGVLKSRGQLVFTDFFLPPDGTLDQGPLRAWAETERLEPHPVGVPQMTGGLEAAGFDVRTVEDLTAQYRQGLRIGLGKLHDHLQSKELDSEARQLVVEEVSLLTRRLRAIDDGLQMRRVHAILPASAEADGLFQSSMPSGGDDIH